MTVKQILDAEEAYAGADFKIDGATVTQVTAVGQVRSVNAQPTNITIRLDDGTGQLEVKKFIDTQEAPTAEYEVDSHVRVWGRLKSFGGKRYVGAHLIRPITDFNEVNYHMLEATYVHLFYTRGPLGQNGQPAGGNEDSMFVDGGAGANGAGSNPITSGKLSGCSPKARKLFNFMNDTPGGNEGIHLNILANSTGMSLQDVETAADELLSHALIYTTIDDHTWAILEY